MRRTLRSNWSTMRCPTVRASTPKATIPPSVASTCPADISPEVAKPVKTPNMTQPATSLAMPAATVIWPKSRRISPSSLRILATTANEDTLIARATKRVKVSLSASSPKNMDGNSSPTTMPPISGTTRLPAVTKRAGRPSLAMRPRSVSNPVTTNSSATPTQLTARRASVSSPWGRNHSKPDSHTTPNTDGPSTRPAISAPTTEGNPTLLITMPKRWAAVTRAKI